MKLKLGDLNNMELGVLLDALTHEHFHPSRAYRNRQSVEWRTRSTTSLLELVEVEVAHRNDNEDTYMDEEARSMAMREGRD